jgi:hypothetical protein
MLSYTRSSKARRQRALVFPGGGSLEKIYGALTFYLANKEVVEAYLVDQERLWEEAAKSQPPLPGSLAERLQKARRELVSR